MSSPDTTVMDKTSWDSNAIFIFFRLSVFLHKTVHPFRNFLAVIPSPHPVQIETRKEFWIHASNIVCGVMGEVGPMRTGKRPVPRPLSMIV